MQRLLLTFFTFLLLVATIAAQRNCSSMDVLEQQMEADPGLEQRMEQIENFTRDFVRSPSGARNVITIPVVVNVIYNNSAENVSDAQIQSQIDVLNEDFRRTNSDADNTWSQASDVQIEFCLASTDPDGNATNGIRRQSSSKRDWRTNDDMKRSSRGGIDPWNTSDYMNIWVCDIKGGILGYAQFPGGSAATDGIVIDYAYFGRFGSAQPPFNLGRTATHEVGHYLNLRHIWGDGPCSVDDFVGDTPTSDAPNYGCATGHVSCNSTDMVENYMDYSDDACMNLFTGGQTTRMRALFAPGGARASLANSDGCGGGNPPAEPTCDDGIQNGQETGIDCGGPACAACEPVSCDAPTGLSTRSRKRGREADLNWNASSGANSYLVEFRAQGASSWSSGTTTNTTIRVTGLTRNNVYEFRVTANCTGGSATSAIHVFTAGQSSRLFTTTVGLAMFPNPTSAELNVSIGDLFETTEVIGLNSLSTLSIATDYLDVGIIDVNGRVLSRQRFDSETDLATLNVRELANGMYFLTVSNTEGELIASERFLVSR